MDLPFAWRVTGLLAYVTRLGVACFFFSGRAQHDLEHRPAGFCSSLSFFSCPLHLTPSGIEIGAFWLRVGTR